MSGAAAASAVRLVDGANQGVPVHAVDRAAFAALAPRLPAATARWLQTCGFDAAPHRHVLVAAADGSLQAVWAGVAAVDDPFVLGALPRALPPGDYRLAGDEAGAQTLAPDAAVLSWTLGAYAFERYKPAPRAPARLLVADGAAARRAVHVARAVTATRDLVNTPAEDLGPAELAAAVRDVADAHGARFAQTVGGELLERGYPAIHAVGRAAGRGREPRLIELRWGRAEHPLLAIVGKGVCFDTGGLDIKASEGMRLMKKDMGGAAHALALAQLVMALALPVRLWLLIPAVDNAIAGDAFRPGDVVPTRLGRAVEIGNTDAEGRVILADALARAAEQAPALLIDLATLTGAARVALGPELPALFCRDLAQARRLVDRGLALRDPLWHLPLWAPYHASIESDIADIVNTGKGPMAGAITAALFLQDFVPAAQDWLHLDLYAWNATARAGRPVGGEAQALRTLLAHVEERFGTGAAA